MNYKHILPKKIRKIISILSNSTTNLCKKKIYEKLFLLNSSVRLGYIRAKYSSDFSIMYLFDYCVKGNHDFLLHEWLCLSLWLTCSMLFPHASEKILNFHFYTKPYVQAEEAMICLTMISKNNLESETKFWCQLVLTNHSLSKLLSPVLGCHGELQV